MQFSIQSRLFSMWVFRAAVTLIRVHFDHYFSILILNFIWKKHHASERTFPSLTYNEQVEHFKSVLYHLLRAVRFHSQRVILDGLCPQTLFKSRKEHVGTSSFVCVVSEWGAALTTLAKFAGSSWNGAANSTGPITGRWVLITQG